MRVNKVEAVQFEVVDLQSWDDEKEDYVHNHVITFTKANDTRVIEFSEPTDEGYSFRRDVYTWDGDNTIIHEASYGGRDCDGEQHHTYFRDYDISKQEWGKHYDSRQYDQYAEMAGY